MNPTFSRRSLVSPASPSSEVTVPSSVTVPDVGKSMAPARFKSVDLPQPLRPTRATNSPAWNSRETSSSATTGTPSVTYSLLTRSSRRTLILPVSSHMRSRANRATCVILGPARRAASAELQEQLGQAVQQSRHARTQTASADSRSYRLWVPLLEAAGQRQP